jgi:general secretion pathway protein L
VNFFRTVVGIDPSGKRLALAAVRYGLGRPSVAVPPAVFDLRGDREQARREDAERILLDFVARNGLAGGEARLAIPADKVFIARVSLPPLKEKDLRPALALELDRIFPFPASRLKFNWHRSGDAAGRKNVWQVVVAAVPSEYLGQWEELVSRAGLSLTGAVPSGWALSAACRWVGEEAAEKTGGLCAILRDLDGAVECTAMDGGETFFSAVRTCPPEAAPGEAFSLLEEALVDAPPSLAEAGVSVVAPLGWCREGKFPQAGDEFFRPVDGFDARAANAMAGPEGPADTAAVWGALGACGAALGEKSLDLLSPEKEGAGFHAAARTATGTLAAVTLLLALSWPASVAWRTRQEVNRLDAAIASLRPAVARVEETLSLLGDIEGRIAVLREARAGREEPLLILRQMTERLPEGTWLTGLRLEERKVELEGFSPSANEIFPLLSRDGQFRKVEFASPITRQADNLERFQIRAEFTPSPPLKQGEGGRNP